MSKVCLDNWWWSTTCHKWTRWFGRCVDRMDYPGPTWTWSNLSNFLWRWREYKVNTSREHIAVTKSYISTLRFRASSLLRWQVSENGKIASYIKLIRFKNYNNCTANMFLSIQLFHAKNKNKNKTYTIKKIKN